MLRAAAIAEENPETKESMRDIENLRQCKCGQTRRQQI